MQGCAQGHAALEKEDFFSSTWSLSRCCAPGSQGGPRCQDTRLIILSTSFLPHARQCVLASLFSFPHLLFLLLHHLPLPFLLLHNLFS